jgi:hypothetical protein
MSFVSWYIQSPTHVHSDQQLVQLFEFWRVKLTKLALCGLYVCVCVCVYVFVCVCVCVCVFSFECECDYVCMHMCMCIITCICDCLCECVYIFVCFISFTNTTTLQYLEVLCRLGE